MDDRMDRLFRGWPRVAFNEEFEGWTVPLDVVEEDDRIVIKATVPGIKPDDIDVTVEGDTLTIRGETKEEHEEKKDNYLMRERKMGKFYRTLRIPDVINAENAETKYENGVLTVAFPKVEAKKARRLEVKTG
jgi:HSP20 family protein